MRLVAVAVLCMLALSYAGPVAGQAGKAKWTILAYLSDDDLEKYILTNMQEMEAGGFGSDVRMVAQFDRWNGQGDDPSKDDTRDGDWTDARRYDGRSPATAQGHAGGDTLSSAMVENLGEVDMSSPATLRDFLVWGASRAPADRYFVVLSSHGDAWEGALDDSDKGDGTKGMMSVEGIGQALREARQQLGGGAWDVVYFDQCLMATAVMAHAIADSTKVMVAAEEVTPGEGGAFPQYMQFLTANPGADAKALGAGMLTAFKAKYTDSGHPQGVFAVLSWLDLAGEPAFWERFTAFRQSLAAAQGEDALKVLAEARQVTRFEKPSLKDSEALDVFEFAQRVAAAFPSGPLHDAAAALEGTRAGFVGGALAAPERAGAKGITMQFGVPGGFSEQPAAPDDPSPQAAAQNPGAAVAANAAEADTADPVVTRFDVTSKVAGDGSLVRFRAEVSDAHLAVLDGVVTVREGGRHVVQRFLPGEVRAEGGVTTADFTWDGKVHALVSGTQREPVLTYREDPTKPTVTVDGVYRSGGAGAPVNASLAFNEATGALIAAYAFDDVTGASEIRVQPRDTFAGSTFTFGETEDDAVELTGDPVAAGQGRDPWRLELVSLPAGTYGVSMYAEDLVGRATGTDVVEVTVSLPAPSGEPDPAPSPAPAPAPSPTPPPEEKGAPGPEAVLVLAAVLGLARMRRRS